MNQHFQIFMMAIHIVAFSLTIAACQSLVIPNVTHSQHWDALKVTWGRNFSSSYVFADMPRHESEAIQQNFTLISDCTHPLFLGFRYVKNNDFSVVLIYDYNGYIAGIQTGFPNSRPDGYPSHFLNYHPIIPDGTMSFITAYFVDPAIICSGGRSALDFAEQGTGTDLYIQNCSDPYSAIKVPYAKADAESNNTLWGNTKCFPTMGHHYWYNLRVNMSCDEFYPMFLLYDHGKLSAFGWAFATNLVSPRVEYPPKPFLGYFMDPVPKCLYQLKHITTLHFYLNGDPRAIKCV